MIAAYLDSSVVLRIITRAPNPLPEWNTLSFGVSSQLLRVECFRTIERMWRQHELSEEELEAKRTAITGMLRNIELREINPEIARAADPFPTYVDTLDAIHLATALAYRRAQRDDGPILFATHDRQLAKAATALHFDVIGLAA